MLTLQPFASTSTGGASPAVADVGRFSSGVTQDVTAGDGKGELAVASGVGKKATVKVHELSGGTPRVVHTLDSFGGSAQGGPIGISSGRFDGDLIDDIAVSFGLGRKLGVEVCSGRIDDVRDQLLNSRAPFTNAARPAATLSAVGIDRDRDADQVAPDRGREQPGCGGCGHEPVRQPRGVARCRDDRREAAGVRVDRRGFGRRLIRFGRRSSRVPDRGGERRPWYAVACWEGRNLAAALKVAA